MTPADRRGALAIVALALACGAPPAVDEPVAIAPVLEPLESPAGGGAMAPHLEVDGDDLLLSWLEPRGDAGHRFLFSRRSAAGAAWSAPVTIAEGDDFFANWADVPKVAVAGDGTLWAHWLAKIGDGAYAYGIFLARSADGGATWIAEGMLHDDRSPTEHGFVAWAAEGEGVRAVWLDGREMADGGAMAVRTAMLDDGVGEATVIDPRVCECCPTELVATPDGAVAFYRDRSEEEVRDVAWSRLEGAAWSPPAAVEADGWQIPGCPVNGPAAAAGERAIAVGWFTAADNRPQVRIAFARHGEVLGTPLTVDEPRPLGRVDVVAGRDDDFWMSWLALEGDAAALRLARFGPDGERQRWRVDGVGASRASGIPRLARHGDRVVVAWVDLVDDRPSGLLLASLGPI